MASSVKGRDKAVLTYIKKEKYSSQEIPLHGISCPSVLQFPRTSQKNLFVSSDNAVHVFDLSRQKVNKSFRLKSKVTSFVLNNSDAYLAAGCEDGSIQVVTVGTNQTSLPMINNKCTGQRISALKYSSFKVSPFKPSFHIFIFFVAAFFSRCQLREWSSGLLGLQHQQEHLQSQPSLGPCQGPRL